ncbi:MAG: hypothetical protein BJ554DRAFT_2552 [Olpidium bornovanus]|uniref:aspartate kinase n=1 Tax=Olpidium bornovanus TaxID=278681 RepID=A0A8H7ZQB0_9FUNG|nr:MAG: hypothetical protein BJ554DRAFT_2552 [Olpidium bornovanus]
MKSTVGSAGRMFTTLAAAGINIEMISQGASEINISCVIEAAEATRALNAIHDSLLVVPDVDAGKCGAPGSAAAENGAEGGYWRGVPLEDVLDK